MFGLGFGELVVISLLLLLVLGPKKFPELGAGLARGIRNFQKEFSDKPTTKEAISSKASIKSK